MKEGICGIKVSQVVLILITLVSATVLVLVWTKTTFISYLTPSKMRIWQIDQDCNHAKGKWVFDDSWPSYSGSDCKQISNGCRQCGLVA